jgi:hypothetical protein
MNRLARLLIVLAALPATAFAASGQFTFVIGDVTLQKANGTRTVPVRGTPVDAGDRIVTGPTAMVQLTMVDEARISLRPSTEFVVERYGDRADSSEGAVLSLIKGTLRTFTGLLSPSNRDRYTMKTRVASIGIRGSGNILYSCEGADCDPSVLGESRGEGDITVNHTIEGSHAVANFAPGAPAGQPAQQGGVSTVITGPGQTVLVRNAEPPRYIATPRFIADAATNMVNAKGTEAASPAGAATRNFSPSDTQALPTAVSTATPIVGNNGLGFPTIDASGNLAFDPLNLRDIVVSAGGTFSGQAVAGDLRTENGLLQGYNSYSGTQTSVNPAFTGAARDVQSVLIDGTQVVMGRYENGSLGFSGPGSVTPVPGSIHWIYAASAYPPYLSDVLTGTATYTLVAATAPTNQNNVAGTLGSARIDANFTQHTLNFAANVAIPAQGGASGGSWQVTGDNVPIALNAFFASTNDRLVIVNGTGQSSRTNGNLGGSVEGSFVGTGLSGVILGYSITDATSSNPTNWNFVNGVAALQGPRQNAATPYREGRFSDADGQLSGPVLTYAATGRPDEIVSDAQGRLTQFTAPRASLGGLATYTLGSAQVVESGVDPQTGMIWGRWAGGNAQATRGSTAETVNLAQSSLHYIVAGPQSGPVSLPLTGTAVYDVIGSTHPTDFNGHVGTLNSATLNANFTNRTVDASVNIAINGQTWTGVANGMPIYRDQYFSAVTGTPGGLPNPAPLVIGCQPSCGQGATGSFDGFFTGTTGQRAGMMYRLGLNQGAVAFGRR